MFVLEKLEVSAGLHTQDSTQVSDATPIEATFHALPSELILGRPLKKGAPGKSDILCANDSSISKEHAVLQLGSAPGPGRAPTAVLKDISRFGTFVRGQKLDNGASVSLQNGDVFKLGHKTCFRLRLKPIHLARKDLQPDVKERASTLGAHVCTDWSPQVTHVIQETGSELVPATVAASLTHIPVVTSAWLAAMTSRKVFPASELPNPAAYQPEEVLLLQPSRTAVPLSAVQALRSEMRLLQGLHFAFLGGFEDAGLRACISLLGGVVDEVPRPGSLVVTSDTCPVLTGALPQTTSAITAAELLACILAKDRGALNRRLAPLPVTQPPNQVLVPPGQQQQDAEDLDITEPGSEEVEDPASVQGGGAAATRAGTHHAASPGSRAKQDSSKTAAKGEHMHRGRGGGGKGGASRMPVLLPPTPGGPKPQASAADATSPAGAGSRRGSVGAVGPETAFSEAAAAKASPVGVGAAAAAAAAAAADAPAARGPKAGAALPSTGALSAAPAVTAKRKRAEQEEKEEVEEEQAGAGATEDGRAGTEGEVQDGVQAAPATVHTTKRTRKTKAQPPDTTPEGEEEGGDTHLDSVFGEAPAAKPLNIADMLSPREPPPPAKEQQAKPDPTKRTRTQQEPEGLAQAGGHTTGGPQQRQQLQQKRANKAAAQAEADKAFERPSGNGTQRGAVGIQQDQREKGRAGGVEQGSEEGVSHVPPTCIRAPLIVKSVDWEGGAHEALEGMDAGEGAPIQGPNFKRFRKAGANVCLPDHAMPRPKFSLIRVDAFQATDASNAFLKGEQARRMALKRAEELFVANPKPKKHVRGKL